MKFLNGIKTDSLMLINMLYNRGNKDNDYVDTLDIIYRNTVNGDKKLYTIENPDIEIYFTKEEYRDYSYVKSHIDLDKVDKHTCPIKNVAWYVAKQAGPDYVEALQQMRETGNFSDMRKIHKYPYVFGSDMDAESFYRVNWLMEYDNDCTKTLTKSYLDIETDTINISGFPRNGDCPINAVTCVDENSKSVYTFLLNNPDNPLIQQFVDDIDGVIKELHEMFDESYGSLNYNIYMYDDELKMLKDLFNMINVLKADFMLVWNGMGFDYPYIIDRIRVLGGDPDEIMTHPDFKNRKCKFIKDRNNYAVATKGDVLELSSYTKFLDQMILYAATRKGQKELSSYSLNAIAEEELGDKKLDYSDEADIKTLPYKNYRKFVIYNIKDTLLLYGLENKVNDIDNLYLRSYSNCCPYDKVFKQTFMLKRRAYYEYLLQGNILGNNINVFNEKDGSFDGAIVGDPELNSNNGIELFDTNSKYIYDDGVDMDFSAMYPYIIVTFNIERNCMIGKLFIDEFTEERYDHIYTSRTGEMYDNSDDDDNGSDMDEPACLKEYDAGKDFMDNYLTGDIISVGTKWFNLPSYTDILTDFKTEFNIKPKRKYSIKNVIKFISTKLNIEVK